MGVITGDESGWRAESSGMGCVVGADLIDDALSGPVHLRGV